MGWILVNPRLKFTKIAVFKEAFSWEFVPQSNSFGIELIRVELAPYQTKGMKTVCHCEPK